MTATTQAITYDLDIKLNTDHEWRFRRVTDVGTPLIVSDVAAQIRSYNSSKLWLELECNILDDGWIQVIIPKASLQEDGWWASKYNGVWDMLVIYNNKQYCWVQGNVFINDTVTQDD